MIRRVALVYVLLLCAVGGAFAQERLLLPIGTRTEGAFGTRWSTRAAVFNPTAAPVVIAYPRDCFDCTPLAEVAPGEDTLVNYSSAPPERPGWIVYVDSPGELDWSYHLWNLASDDLFETALPVVRDRDLRLGSTHLVNVPINDRSRYALRLYSMDWQVPTAVTVRIFAQPSHALLATAEITLQPSTNRFSPAYAEIANLTAAYPNLLLPNHSENRVIFEVTPAVGSPAIWPLLSMTNNLTQHVVLFWPQ